MSKTFKTFLIDRILKEQETGYASNPEEEDKVIIEPEEKTDTPEDSEETETLPDIYELYPNLSEVDITCPCMLADFFATMCEHLQDDDNDKEDGEDPDKVDEDEIKITLGSEDEFGSY